MMLSTMGSRACPCRPTQGVSSSCVPGTTRVPTRSSVVQPRVQQQVKTLAVQSGDEGTHGEGSTAARRNLLLAAPVLASLASSCPTAFAEEALTAETPAPAAVEASPTEAPAAPAAPAPAPPSTSAPSFEGKFGELYDEILAYKFKYPVATASGKPLKMLLSHPPEKYSSAAPLTADARQRIVGELLDLRNFVSASVSVGPASGVLKNSDPSQWKPFDVALTVLIDRSTSRLTTGQRTALNDIEEAHIEDRDGNRYYVYEHLAQGSPTITNPQNKETYRHSLAATSVRPDRKGTPYLYTLNLSCRQELWDDLQPLFKESVDSFRLVPTTDKYIAPDVRPWQFW